MKKEDGIHDDQSRNYFVHVISKGKALQACNKEDRETTNTPMYNHNRNNNARTPKQTSLVNLKDGREGGPNVIRSKVRRIGVGEYIKRES